MSFSYTREKPLLQNISIDVKSGQRIAIVGPTGCGKTTLINLLMRFFTTCAEEKNHGRRQGHTEFDAEITAQKALEWCSRIRGLKAERCAKNIAYGKPDATDEEIRKASEGAYAHSFIKRLPNGYDTRIGEGGTELSAGQKQLICIARVMLCLPPMLILDEATSSIDTRTEIKIQSAFAKMMQGRTSFIVAHRLSTIREADVILVMRAGNIIEQGTHKELFKQKRIFTQCFITAVRKTKTNKTYKEPRFIISVLLFVAYLYVSAAPP
ncbi:MAG: ATP-binding cassette domain-containing protein [Clostridiales bacterium]|nr:MAG: ATP-binding cassette domain-containing protein [Clostridiales bacterium]